MTSDREEQATGSGDDGPVSPSAADGSDDTSSSAPAGSAAPEGDAAAGSEPTPDTSPGTDDSVEPDESGATADGAEDEPEAAGDRGRSPLLVGLLVIAIVLLIGQTLLLVSVLNTRSKVERLGDDVEALAAAPVDAAAATASPAPAPAATAAGGGNLPRFAGAGSDPALGRTVEPLTAPEYGTGAITTVDPTDGTARAYLVWAHWCTYCQQELPLVSEWNAENAERYDGVELVTVTTAIDETAGNPLEPYLEANDFDFPVLVDQSGELARQLGVNAFPFWVFTAPDGTVVGRVAGLIGPDGLETVFDQLEDL